MSDTKHTPGPWNIYRMTDADTGEPITPKAFGVYVENSVIRSEKESGSFDIYYISVEKEDGPADVCHVGNGPTSLANGLLLATAPELLEWLEKYQPCEASCRSGFSHDPCDCGLGVLIAKAKGETA